MSISSLLNSTKKLEIKKLYLFSSENPRRRGEKKARRRMENFTPLWVTMTQRIFLPNRLLILILCLFRFEDFFRFFSVDFMQIDTQSREIGGSGWGIVSEFCHMREWRFFKLNYCEIILQPSSGNFNSITCDTTFKPPNPQETSLFYFLLYSIKKIER